VLSGASSPKFTSLGALKKLQYDRISYSLHKRVFFDALLHKFNQMAYKAIGRRRETNFKTHGKFYAISTYDFQGILKGDS